MKPVDFPLSISHIANTCQSEVIGNPLNEVLGVCSIDAQKAGHICYLANHKKKKLLSRDDVYYIVSDDLKDHISKGLYHPNPAVAFRLLAKMLRPLPKHNKIEKTAVIDPSAKIGKNVYIGHYSIIGKDVSIADGVQIEAHCHIKEKTSIGQNTYIGSQATIEDQTKIGDYCQIYSHVVIGSEGFGYNFENNKWKHIPQLGRVVIGNYVEIGAHTCIDRGAIQDTIIHDNVIIDNLVHIAHNVEIGEGSAMAAFVGVAGSTKIGKYCMFGGKAGIVGHINITDHVHINGGSNVLQPIDKSGSYTGTFHVLPTRKWHRMATYLKRIELLFKREKQSVGTKK